MKCAWHLCLEEAVFYNGKGKFCSKQCKNKYHVDKKRKKLKQDSIEYKGGKCQCCGYNRSHWALEFHHLDPQEKDFHLSKGGHTRSWEKVKEELNKCILVCSNCHSEIHHGVRIIN